MAHVEKYNMSAVGHMLQHYSRESNASNINIDPARTQFNYNLAPPHPDQTDYEYLKERLGQVKVQNRKDVNLICSWVVTAPKDLPKDEEPAFFEAVYEFLEGKYGKENTVSAWVHQDETTPHIHYCFCPVVKSINKKTQQPIEKVSAKEVLTRTELQNFHPDLQAHVERALGHEVAVLNGATKEGNRAIAELRRESASERLQKAEQEAQNILAEAKAQVGPAKAEYEALKAYIDSSKKLIKPINEKQIKTKGLLHKTQVVEVPFEEWEARSMRSNELKALEQARLRLDNEVRKLEATDFVRDLNNLQYLYSNLEQEARALKERNQKLELVCGDMLLQKDKFFQHLKEQLPQPAVAELMKLWDTCDPRYSSRLRTMSDRERSR